MKTENEILEMAFAMFLDRGFSDVSTNELIRAAGLTKGGFYYSFKSREDLDQRVIEKYIKPYFDLQLAEMQRVWEESRKDIPTEELLWKGFFQPQKFAKYQTACGKDISFRSFYLLLHEGMKKFPCVIEAFGEYSKQKQAILRRILERGQMRGEVLKEIDFENTITLLIAMQGGILALKVLDDTIDDEEKYRKIQQQMWNDISAEKLKTYLDGGVTSAVS